MVRPSCNSLCLPGGGSQSLGLGLQAGSRLPAAFGPCCDLLPSSWSHRQAEPPRDSPAEEYRYIRGSVQEKYVGCNCPSCFCIYPFRSFVCGAMMAQSKRRKVPSLQSTCIQYAPPHPRWREAARSPVALLSSSGGGSMRSHHRRRPCRRSYACHSGNRHRNRMSTRHRRPPA